MSFRLWQLRFLAVLSFYLPVVSPVSYFVYLIVFVDTRLKREDLIFLVIMKGGAVILTVYEMKNVLFILLDYNPLIELPFSS